MKHQITLREANQHLSRYVRSVEEGQEWVITRRGKPVARLVPIPAERKLSAEQLAALERSRQRMRKGYDLGGRMPSRDEPGQAAQQAAQTTLRRAGPTGFPVAPPPWVPAF